MQNSKPTIIAITGASASGKSLFSHTIYKELVSEIGEHGISIIKEDAYYREQSHLSMEQRIRNNYDHPDAFEHSLLTEHLKQLVDKNRSNALCIVIKPTLEQQMLLL